MHDLALDRQIYEVAHRVFTQPEMDLIDRHTKEWNVEMGHPPSGWTDESRRKVAELRSRGIDQGVLHIKIGPTNYGWAIIPAVVNKPIRREQTSSPEHLRSALKHLNSKLDQRAREMTGAWLVCEREPGQEG